MELSHFNEAGKARMVDVTAKNDTVREAVAEGRVTMRPQTLELVKKGAMGKGDVLAVAQVGGIMGAKRTWELIPMCHPLLLTGVNIEFTLREEISAIDIRATVKTTGKTGVEMEALTAVSVAALTIYDMCKAVDKDMIVEYIRLTAKSGGKSGNYQREESV
ncbi:molybdenum cofactor biosynthesis protein C [Thermosinus carboxydivorans Nor1]|uniref:Cyclic pyranopterin monophosphate synthase n=1 Tax=Thermosinus carboxydivorans Nor1 TaxID=401526 RepID=A1HS24_9FIRM|nr:cyclic pyranopterin monophosphate synthase MoaC [Thermosinus carboxydivorans]EAX47199.1 molybdenum cofactor biosynthesis protein C [Thermosinus carboxydivorans Nor1]